MRKKLNLLNPLNVVRKVFWSHAGLVISSWRFAKMNGQRIAHSAERNEKKFNDKQCAEIFQKAAIKYAEEGGIPSDELIMQKAKVSALSVWVGYFVFCILLMWVLLNLTSAGISISYEVFGYVLYEKQTYGFFIDLAFTSIFVSLSLIVASITFRAAFINWQIRKRAFLSVSSFLKAPLKEWLPGTEAL